MALRWPAAAMNEAKKGFRRLKPTSNFLPCGSRLPLTTKRRPSVALFVLRRPLNVFHRNARFTKFNEARGIPVPSRKIGKCRAMYTNFQTHMFWAYGNFSNVEKITAKSFVKNGYQLNVWTYGDISNVPSGASVKDAREILPEPLYFELPSGSCAPFSDYFRYSVLNKVGGMWVDTDVISLKMISVPPEPFLVTERTQKGIKRVVKDILGRKASSQICNNVIFNPIPTPGNMIDLAYLYAERFPKEKVQWGELGPALLSAFDKIHPKHGFSLKAPEFANSIDFWDCPRKLLEPRVKLHPDAVFLHLYNETWREAKIDKNAPFPKRSLMSLFAEEHL